jgi:hypothetical protein
MKTSDAIAALALFLSTASALFAFFQWAATEHEARTTATVDISRKYLEDSEINNQLMHYRGDTSSADINHRLISHLNYIAYLTNEGRLDRRYLAPQITCDMDEIMFHFIDRNTPAEKGFKFVEVAEIQKYLSKDATCPSAVSSTYPYHDVEQDK